MIYQLISSHTVEKVSLSERLMRPLLCLTVFTDNTSLKCESLALFHAECTLPMERVQEAAEWKLKEKKVNVNYRGL